MPRSPDLEQSRQPIEYHVYRKGDRLPPTIDLHHLIAEAYGFGPEQTSEIDSQLETFRFIDPDDRIVLAHSGEKLIGKVVVQTLTREGQGAKIWNELQATEQGREFVERFQANGDPFLMGFISHLAVVPGRQAATGLIQRAYQEYDTPPLAWVGVTQSAIVPRRRDEALGPHGYVTYYTDRWITPGMERVNTYTPHTLVDAFLSSFQKSMEIERIESSSLFALEGLPTEIMAARADRVSPQLYAAHEDLRREQAKRTGKGVSSLVVTIRKDLVKR